MDGSGIARGFDAGRLANHKLVLSALASESHASCAPSGDHTGLRSCAPGTLRKVAVVALLRRHCEDLAPRLECGANWAKAPRS